MAPCKITVLKTYFDRDLAEEYRRPDIHSGPCEHYSEGQEFLVRYLGLSFLQFLCASLNLIFHPLIGFLEAGTHQLEFICKYVYFIMSRDFNFFI